jgi:hypothetical protein
MKAKILSFATLCSLAAFLLLPLTSNAASFDRSESMHRAGVRDLVNVGDVASGNDIDCNTVLGLSLNAC